MYPHVCTIVEQSHTVSWLTDSKRQQFIRGRNLIVESFVPGKTKSKFLPTGGSLPLRPRPRIPPPCEPAWILPSPCFRPRRHFLSPLHHPQVPVWILRPLVLRSAKSSLTLGSGYMTSWFILNSCKSAGTCSLQNYLQFYSAEISSLCSAVKFGSTAQVVCRQELLLPPASNKCSPRNLCVCGSASWNFSLSVESDFFRFFDYHDSCTTYFWSQPSKTDKHEHATRNSKAKDFPRPALIEIRA